MQLSHSISKRSSLQLLHRPPRPRPRRTWRLPRCQRYDPGTSPSSSSPHANGSWPPTVRGVPLRDAAATGPEGVALPREAAKDKFEWAAQWYPLVPTSYLEKGKPKGLVVLGRSLVVWYHAPSETWQCFEDRCPHRLAPLSEGRVDPATGSLACAYHGWEFGPQGRCTRIPQADSPEQEVAALGSPRACVARFPVRQEQGLLWVWMDSGAGAELESRARPVALPSELQQGTGVLLGDWYMRDLPISFEFLAENLLDPSHVSFAHHGVISTRSRAGPIRLLQQGELSAQGGFAVRMEPTAMPGGMPAVTRFVPPSLTWLTFGPGDGSSRGIGFSMLFYAVPVAPGHSRIIAGYSASGAPPLLRQVLSSEVLTPLLHAFQWLGDLGSHEVIEGDAVLLHYQEEAAAAIGRGRGDLPPLYFMPASCDRGVALLRRWMLEYAGGGPSYGSAAAPGPQGPHLSREQILDRYDQHTKDCPHCSKALRNIQATRAGLSLATTSGLAASFTLAVLPALLLPPLRRGLIPLPPFILPLGSARGGAPLVLLAGAGACALLNRALGTLEEQLTFTDYTHWDKQ